MSEERAEYTTSSLIDRARLTEGEASRAYFRRRGHRAWSGDGARDIADAATAKALYAVADWLAASGGAVILLRDGTSDDAADALADILQQAGIERP